MNSNDFNILPDEPNPAPGRKRLVWLVVIAAAVFLFAVGMAVATFTNRMSGNPEAAADEAAALLPTLTPTGNSAINPTLTFTPGGTPATDATAVDTTPAATVPGPTLNVTPATAVPATATAVTAPTNTPGCSRGTLIEFVPVYTSALGCATNDGTMAWSAWERFERGAMFWRSDNDRAYAFFNDSGWSPIDEKWEGQEIPTRGDPPPGLRAPERGFGYAWSQRDDLFQRLGWANDQERGFCAVIQSFEHGFILQSSTVEFCQDQLFNHARSPEWQPLFIVAVENVGWRNFAGAAAVTPFPTPTTVGPTAAVTPGVTPQVTVAATATTAAVATATPPPTATVDSSTQQQRPDGNGTFRAASGGHTLDGDLGDWSGNWQPIGAMVQGAENYSGPDDLRGDFQVGWSLEGLYLAVRVSDDRYRAGPNGTDMWQGDSLEIHLDRALALDYTNAVADTDDYQLGVSFGEGRNEIRLYRWLPFAQEGAFPISGAVRADGEGYAVELLIPWTLFDVTSGDLGADKRFGFNLSISDNDGDSPAQESLLSSSPARTTYNNPTEWGTLILE